VKSRTETLEALPFLDAQACILDKINPLDTEEVALRQALGRALAEEVRANRDLPPYDLTFTFCSRRIWHN